MKKYFSQRSTSSRIHLHNTSFLGVIIDSYVDIRMCACSVFFFVRVVSKQSTWFAGQTYNDGRPRAPSRPSVQTQLSRLSVAVYLIRVRLIVFSERFSSETNHFVPSQQCTTLVAQRFAPDERVDRTSFSTWRSIFGERRRMRAPAFNSPRNHRDNRISRLNVWRARCVIRVIRYILNLSTHS